MKNTINLYDFRDAFTQIRPDNFSYQGLEILFDWFEEYEASTGEETELDVIAICCEWSETTREEIIQYYDIPEDERENLVKWLNERTIVAGETTESIIFMDF